MLSTTYNRRDIYISLYIPVSFCLLPTLPRKSSLHPRSLPKLPLLRPAPGPTALLTRRFRKKVKKKKRRRKNERQTETERGRPAVSRRCGPCPDRPVPGSASINDAAHTDMYTQTLLVFLDFYCFSAPAPSLFRRKTGGRCKQEGQSNPITPPRAEFPQGF